MVTLIPDIYTRPGNRIAVLLRRWHHNDEDRVNFSITSCVKSVNYTIAVGVKAIGVKYSITSDIKLQAAVGCASWWRVSTLGTHLYFTTGRRNWQCKIWGSSCACCIRLLGSEGNQRWWRRSWSGSCCQSEGLGRQAAAAGSRSCCWSRSRHWCQSK